MKARLGPSRNFGGRFRRSLTETSALEMKGWWVARGAMLFRPSCRLIWDVCEYGLNEDYHEN